MRPRPFISYAREDHEIANKLYDDLRALGAEPWLDKRELLGGQDWQETIRTAVRECSHFIALLSANSVSKRGFVQKELREAITTLEEFPPGEIFVIPVRLESVEPKHEALKKLHWVDLFPSYVNGLQQLARSLEQTPPETIARSTPVLMGRVDRRVVLATRLIPAIAIAVAIALILVLSLIKLRHAPRWLDQYNCGPDERWVGMTPSTTERSFQLTAEQAEHAVFHGELRWSPEINQRRQTTIGEVELEVDGKQHVIYKWNSPSRSTHIFDVAISHFLVGTSRRFKIRWRWENGTSGICVVKSDVEVSPLPSA